MSQPCTAKAELKLRGSRRAVLLGVLGVAGLFGIALPALLAAEPAAPIAVRDDLGTEHRLSGPARRIVTLMPSLTEAVWVLGGGPRLVGVDRHSNWPAEVALLPRMGGLDDARIEAIAALRPDLVLAGSSSRGLDRLDALGYTVVRLNSDTHADARRTLEIVARLLGRPEEGPRAWSSIEKEIDAAAARVPPAWRGRTAWFEVGEGYVAGPASFIGQTLTRLGLAHAVPAQLGPFPKLNPEFGLRARPDLLLGSARGLADLARRPGWNTIPALREGRSCGFETRTHDVLVRPGPRLGEAAALLADCLQRLPPPPERRTPP